MKKYLVLLMAVFAASNVFAQFKPGNIAVLRVGDGSSSMSTSCAVSLLEYTTAGMSVGDPIAIPSETAGKRLVLDVGGSTEYSQLRLSANGQYLSFVGNDTTLGLMPNAAATKVIARVGVNKVVDLTTNFLMPKGASVRGAVSDDGSNFWVNNSNGQMGFLYVPYGNSALANPGYAVVNTNNYRSAQIYNNELYALNGGGYNLCLLGAGSLPNAKTAPTTTIAMPDLAVPASSVCFYLFDQSTKEPGLDVAYIFDGNGNTPYPTKAGNNMLRKFCKVAGTWQETGAIEVKNFGEAPPSRPDLLRDLTGEIGSDGKVTLYAIRGVNTNSTLVAFKDASGYNGTLTEAAVTFKSLANAGTNYAFKGVALTPAAKGGKPAKK
ncbi:hypothetical protein BDD43_4840 [Mucilaginibacter gracilis]|uniref:Uncharacterized protein n=1 Tax=Mucilaginibacter gracilis TaxID=423350 RepID=A0A495J892_9SPHI|nr:hypothetical protein [Mucilaginibacter gracilis]RKR84594.1 hypothetical protein BDD43_4840 [Mucilaginibacter gracilis]